MTRQGGDVEQQWRSELRGCGPEAVLRWADATFGDSLTMACSFGGVTGIALLDLARSVVPSLDVFSIDTGFLFPETVAFRERLRKEWKFRLRVVSPLESATEQAERLGDRLWETSPDTCCALRKVEPAVRALEGKRAWIVGLRRDQSDTRESVEAIDWDSANGLYRVAPFWSWTEEQILDWTLERGVPVHPLIFAGYPSIGCTHCTRPVAPGDPRRSGRWKGSGKRECGLHQRPVGEGI
ncbi:MAG: phosphoadenylyl-sulfate reductase [Armatimonadota bacterium]